MTVVATKWLITHDKAQLTMFIPFSFFHGWISMDKMVLFTMKGPFTPALFSLVESRQSCPPLFVLAGVNVALAPKAN